MDCLHKLYFTVLPANNNYTYSNAEIKVTTFCKLLTISYVSLLGSSVEVCCELVCGAACSIHTCFHPLLIAHRVDSELTALYLWFQVFFIVILCCWARFDILKKCSQVMQHHIWEDIQNTWAQWFCAYSLHSFCNFVIYRKEYGFLKCQCPILAVHIPI